MGDLKYHIAVIQRNAAEAKLDQFYLVVSHLQMREVEKQRLQASLMERAMFWSATVNRLSR